MVPDWGGVLENIDDVTNRRAVYALSYRVLIGHKLANGLVSEIISIKVSDTQADTQTNRLTIRVT